MKDPKKPRRKRKKHPALDPGYNPKIRRDNIDADYLHKLTPEELDFYNKFMEETNNASFSNTDADLYQDVKEKRKLYTENNARQRCIFSTEKAKGRLIITPEASIMEREKDEDSACGAINRYEDAMIEYLDSDEYKESKKKD